MTNYPLEIREATYVSLKVFLREILLKGFGEQE